MKETCSTGEQVSKGGRGIEIQEAGSVRNIHSWLNKNGEVLVSGVGDCYLKDKQILI